MLLDDIRMSLNFYIFFSVGCGGGDEIGMITKMLISAEWAPVIFLKY